MVKIGVADFCSATRRGLKAILKQHPEFAVQWDAGDSHQTFQLLAKKPVRLLILDMELGGHGNGLGLVQKIHSQFPQVADLVYTSPYEEGWACEALRAGAAAFLLKNASEKELICAIHKIAADGMYLTASQMEYLAMRSLSNGHSTPSWEMLSTREKEIIQLIAAGNSIKEIANRLKLSSSTVATYRARILQKLGLKCDADLVRFVDRRGAPPSNGSRRLS